MTGASQLAETAVSKNTMGIFDFFRKRSSHESAPNEETEFQALVQMDEVEFQLYQKKVIAEFRKHDYLGFAATAKHAARAALKVKQYDEAWKLFHEQKLHYMKHATRSGFTRLQILALDASVSEDLANLLRLEGRHQEALVHALYWVAASPRRTKAQGSKLPAYFNRARLNGVGYSEVEELLKLVRDNPELPIVQRHVKRWTEGA